MSDTVLVTFRVSNPSIRSFAAIAALCRPALDSAEAEELERTLGCAPYSFTIHTDPQPKSCDVLLKLRGRSCDMLKDLTTKLAIVLAQASRREVIVTLSTDETYRLICKPPLNN